MIFNERGNKLLGQVDIECNASENYCLYQVRLDPGIYLVDIFGNEILLHGEAPGCFDPMPIAPRKRPPVIASKVDLTKSEGSFYVQDVYTGQFMDRVKRGSVKYIRVVEAPPKRAFPPWKIGDWTPALSADSHHPVATNWNHYNNKRILGTAPVESDGSAYFKVPAGKFVYFQLLDDSLLGRGDLRGQTQETAGRFGDLARSIEAAATHFAAFVF